MANVNPPKKNQAWKTSIALSDLAVSGRVKTNPTIAAGDFTISKDGGGPVNFATLPTVVAAGNEVELVFSATEFNADKVFLLAHDQTVPAEWADWWITILTTA